MLCVHLVGPFVYKSVTDTGILRVLHRNGRRKYKVSTRHVIPLEIGGRRLNLNLINYNLL